MISLRKLASLSDGARLRKIASLLRGMANDMVHQRSVDLSFLRGLGLLLGVKGSSKERFQDLPDV